MVIDPASAAANGAPALPSSVQHAECHGVPLVDPAGTHPRQVLPAFEEWQFSRGRGLAGSKPSVNHMMMMYSTLLLWSVVVSGIAHLASNVALLSI